MRILYVIRDRSGSSRKKKLHRWATGFLNGQDGFFEAALHRAGTVTRRSLAEAMVLTPAQAKGFDAVVVNGKCGFDLFDAVAHRALVSRFAGRLALFVGHAQADMMPGDDVLDLYDPVFKREPWADPERYQNSPANRAKLIPTHLANPLAPMSSWQPWEIRSSRPKQMGWEVDPTYDVFFIGKVQSTQFLGREDSWRHVIDSGLEARGGLFTRNGTTLPSALRGAHIDRPDYIRAMQEARVNLGLEGIGTFTFRHLEVLWLGGFLLSNPTVRAQRLRAPLVEGQDYVAFDDHDDMIDKIRHYSAPAQDAERRQIARAGRAAYERLNDIRAHAAEIRAAFAGATHRAAAA